MGLVNPHAAEYPLCASCRNLDVPIRTEPCASCHRAFLKNAEKPGFSPIEDTIMGPMCGDIEEEDESHDGIRSPRHSF